MEIFVIFLLIGGPIAFIFFAAWSNAQAETERLRAKHSYNNKLQALALSPTDPHQRAATLKAGRDYANLTRNKQGVAVFDEVAMNNDIGAACAAMSVAVAPQAGTQSKNDLAEKLRTLNELRSSGLVAENEFMQLRTAILRELAPV